MTLRIHSLRAGFATNSSSTHSVVLLPKHLVGKVRQRASNDDDSFGWDNFVLCSTESKLRYLAAQFFMSYWQSPDARADLIERFAAEIPYFREEMEQEARDWNGKKLGMTVAESDSPPLTVDHQSVLGFNSDKYDPKLVEMLIGFFKGPRVTVLGGNDNGESPDPPAGSERVEWLHMMRDRTSFKVRRDGDFWSGFDTYSGTRLRWSFDGLDTEEVTASYHKASAPELVDLKITDWCDAGCKFCLAPETPVLMADLTWNPIGKIVVGDKVVAFDEKAVITKTRQIKVATVEAVARTFKPAVRITTDATEVVCSLDHRWLMSHTHRWHYTSDLKIAQSIASTTVPWDAPVVTDEYRQGYLSGVFCGDGSARWEPLDDTSAGRQVWCELRMNDAEAVHRAYDFMQRFGVHVDAPSHNGTMWRVGTHSRELMPRLRDLIHVEPSDDHSEAFMRGWLAGFFDAEGSSNHGVVRFCQKDGDAFVRLTMRFLEMLKFDAVIEPGLGVRLRGGRWEAYRFFGMCNPAIMRKRASWFDGGIKTNDAQITRLELLPEQELVDIQTSAGTFIANGLCSHNCYMGSTTKGKHAPLDRIRTIVKMLGDIDVFEIAIGGGEPTAHPDFPIILQMIRDNGMVPNFTTFTDKWLSDDTLVGAVVQYGGGIGVSCLDAKGLALVDKIEKEIRARKNFRIRVVAQHVLGAAPLDVTAEFMREAFKANKDVLLLGYKEIGFGKKHPRHDKHADIYMALALREVTAETHGALSVDTALVDQHPDLLKALKVPKALITSPEGKFSCYVDAVKGKMGASSYVQPKQMEKLVYEREAFLERFARY